MSIRLLEEIEIYKSTQSRKIETSCGVKQIKKNEQYLVDMYGVNKENIEYAIFRGRKYDMEFIKEITQYGLQGNLYVYELKVRSD